MMETPRAPGKIEILNIEAWKESLFSWKQTYEYNETARTDCTGDGSYQGAKR